ncbi:MAG: exopolyphosphatase [Bacteroidota bacterium]
MSQPAYAVIDLGTNTFHLLIAQVQESGFKTLYRERLFVKLGAEGVETLGQASFERGVSAMQHFSTIIQQFQVEAVRAIGTAALRAASNGSAFLDRVKAAADIEVQIISGEEEARLIHQGVGLAIPIHPNERVLIMDIGGGSVEFIIADQAQVSWAESFPVGVAVLFKQFHQRDPIAQNEIQALQNYLRTQFHSLDTALARFPVDKMIGASGTFDVLEDNFPKIEAQSTFSTIALTNYAAFQSKVVQSTQAERLQMPKIPQERADLIVVALLLLEVVLEKLKIEQLSVSHFAMKEGILREMMAK